MHLNSGSLLNTNEIKMKKFVCLFIVSLITFSTFAEHRGRVYVDRNKNQRYDKGDRAAKGVLVSDGWHVVKTGPDGTFVLPGYAGERFIFITVPSGYKCEKYFCRIGSNTEYEFGLQAYPGVGKDGRHHFIQISDTEIFNTQGHEDWVNNLKEYADIHKTAFIVHTGDICYENGLKNHRGLLNTGNTSCPVYYCIGNHDLVKGKYGEELFESIYGPVFYSFEAGNVHYVVTPMWGGDHRPGYTMGDVYRWLKNDLAQLPQGKPVVIFNHDLLTDKDQFLLGPNEQERINLNEHNLKAWMYGHWHINYMKKQGEVYTVSTGTLDKGGIDHSTSAFRVIHMDPKGNFTSELRYSYLDKALCLVTPTEQQTVIDVQGNIPVSVNVYHTKAGVQSGRCSVFMHGHQVAAIALKRSTDWNWQGILKPSDSWLGQRIVVKVEVEFENGEKAVTGSDFIYQPGTCPAVKWGADWNTLGGGSRHNGKGDSLCKAPLQLAWVQNVGANLYMASPVVSDGKVFVASVDENLKGEAAVYALDGYTGRLLWKYPVRNSVKNTIAVESGCVLAQDAEGWLYALDCRTGKLRWEKKLNVNGLPAVIEGLTAADGIVYAGTGKGLSACRIADGEQLWQNEAWGQGEGTTTTLAADRNVLVSGVQWRALYANDARTGKLLWQKSENGLRNRGASAAMYGDLLYLISDRSLFIIRTETGDIVVRKELPYSVDVTSTPLVTDQAIVFGTAKEGLVALDRETLEVKWTFETGDALVYTVPYSRQPASTIETSPVWAGGLIWVGASDGNFYGIDPGKGRQIWTFETGAPVFGSVAVSGNTLVGTDFGGNVYLFVSR